MKIEILDAKEAELELFWDKISPLTTIHMRINELINSKIEPNNAQLVALLSEISTLTILSQDQLMNILDEIGKKLTIFNKAREFTGYLDSNL